MIMPELVLSIKLEGEAADLADIENFLKAAKQLDFPALVALMAKINVTISKMTVTTETVPTTKIVEEQLYPLP
jgi:hypothetical protein